MVWLTPEGLITSTLYVPATAGGAMTLSDAGALSEAILADCPPINTPAPLGIAVP
jgi:hypothetical protein